MLAWYFRLYVVKSFFSSELDGRCPHITLLLCNTIKICFFSFPDCSLVDRFSLDAFANAAFNYKANILDNPEATLFRYMHAFNHSSSADNPIAGLASKSINNLIN